MTDKLPERNSPAAVPEGEEEDVVAADSGSGSRLPVDVPQDPARTYNVATTGESTRRVLEVGESSKKKRKSVETEINNSPIQENEEGVRGGEEDTPDKRRIINEKIRKLKEMIPDCNKTNQEAVLDDAIGYISFLQHQTAGLHPVSRLGLGRPYPSSHAAAGLHPMSGLGPFPAPPHLQGNNQAGSSRTNQEAANANPG